MLSNKRHFIYNLLSSYGNTIISVVLVFVSVPIALNYWGNELYGIWTILTSFATYITASGLGIDAAAGNLMTKNVDIRVKVGILKKSVKLLICSSFVASCIIIILTIAMPDWFKIIGKMDESNYPIAKISALIFVSGIIINLPLNAVSNSLQAFGKAYIGTMITTLQTILNFISILLTVALKFSLPFYVFFTQSVTILCSLIKFCVVVVTIRKETSKLPPTQECPDSEDNHYKTILKMGINMSLYGLALLLVPNISNLIISNNVDVKALVPYSLSYKLFSTTMLFVSNMNIAFAPLMGTEYGKNNWQWLSRTYRRMFYISTTFAVFLVLGVIWLSKPFIKLWTGSFDNYTGNFISVLLGVYFFISAMSNINHVIINSFNYVNKVWLISLTDGIIFLLSSLVLIRSLGVLSVPLGLCIGACLVSSWAYPVVVYWRTKKRFKYDFNYLIKIAIVFLLSVLSFLLISNLDLSFMVVTGLEFLGMFGTSILLFIVLPAEFRNSIFSRLHKK